MRRLLHAAMCAALVVAAASVVWSAQQPQQPPPTAAPADQERPVFRAGATFVTVDVYPTTDGRIVPDLQASDFQVFEDGKLQTIDRVEFIRVAPPVAGVERREPRDQAEGDRMAADPRVRVFVVFLDVYHIGLSGWHAVREPIVKFLDDRLAPDDLFAVMTPESSVRLLAFGRSSQTVDAEFARQESPTRAFEFDVGSVRIRSEMEQRLAACASRPDEINRVILRYRDEQLLTSLENLVGRLDALRDTKKDVLFVSEGWIPAFQQMALLSSSGMTAPPTLGSSRSGFGRTGSDIISSGGGLGGWCANMLNRIGMSMQYRFNDLLRLARGANVTFHAIDPGGLRVNLPWANAGARGIPAPTLARPLFDPTDTLYSLAYDTSGIAVVGTNNLDGGLDRIAEARSSYYLLGYYTNNERRDGAFRDIEVKVTRPRISVAARRGYFAPTERPAAVTTAAAAPLAPFADAALARLATARPEAPLFTYAVASSAGLNLVVELASRHLTLGRWTQGGDVDATVTTAAGEALDVRGSIAPGARGALLHVPVSSASGPWRVAVRITNGNDRLEDRVVIPREPWSLIGPPMLYRATTAPRAPRLPVADFTFRAIERMLVEWPAAEAIDGMTAQVLNGRGVALPIPVAVSAAAGQRDTLVAELTLSSFAAGEYVLDLEARRGDQVERQVAAFRVVR